MEKNSIAIFGGSFNPPINSHIFLAKQILEKYKQIEKIIFVPVSTKYNKRDLVDDRHRYNMLKILCNKESKMEVSDVELKAEKQLYTIQTLDFFKEQYKNSSLYFIMGTDNLKELETWKEPNRILTEYKVIVLERNNDRFKEIIESSSFLKNNRNSLIKVEDVHKIFLSSTMIREKIKKDEDIKGFIDEDVLKYITENNLYK